MSVRSDQSWATITVSGNASARYWQAWNGQQRVIAEFGTVQVHMPFSQAVALRADLDVALAAFDHSAGTAVG
jgi:hypothetical protein